MCYAPGGRTLLRRMKSRRASEEEVERGPLLHAVAEVVDARVTAAGDVLFCDAGWEGGAEARDP